MSTEKLEDNVSLPQSEVAEEKQKTIEFGGKVFDDTPEGREQLAAYGASLTELVGRQSNEVGKLRKYAPSKDEEALLTKVAELRENGEHLQADRLIVSFTKKKELDIFDRLAVERQNDRTWQNYFKSRPELTKLFDEDTIRTVSETKLDVYNSDNSFKVLDDFWLSKVNALKDSFKPGEKSKDEKPPVVLSGGQSRKEIKPESKQESKFNLQTLLDSKSYSKSH